MSDKQVFIDRVIELLLVNKDLLLTLQIEGCCGKSEKVFINPIAREIYLLLELINNRFTDKD